MDLNEHLIKAGASDELKHLILSLAETAKIVSKSFIGRQHKSNSKNVYGEEQVALDKYANQIFIEALKKNKLASSVASEEEDQVIKIPGGKNFSVVLDPLDGSSLVDVNLTIGTIVGIFEGNNVLQTGTDMKAAIIILYGPLTILVYSLGKGVHDFVLNPDSFMLRKENIQIPKQGKLMAIGGVRKDFFPNHLKFIQTLEEEGYKIRYSGSYVADVYQILYKGGVYCYPRLKNKENGKLRLLFEANPIGFLIKQSGGMISNGEVDITSIEPKLVHERTPIYVGGKKEITQANKIVGGIR